MTEDSITFTPEKSKKIALARLDLLNQWKEFRRKSENKLQADYDFVNLHNTSNSYLFEILGKISRGTLHRWKNILNETEDYKKEEATMILNHKRALEFIFGNKDYFKTITLKKLEELHALLINDLGVDKGLRKSPVGIVGTNYKPLSNQLQIKDAVDKLIYTINATENIIEKALITVIMISYIQPFEDGNKRTGRILANAILFANGYCPLSYRSVSESDYKKAVILFYENNSLDYFKELFVEQFKFAVEKYF